jgi:hypothetical protein
MEINLIDAGFKSLRCFVSGGFYPSEEIIITKAFAFLSKVEILERLPDLIADDSPVWKELVNV